MQEQEGDEDEEAAEAEAEAVAREKKKKALKPPGYTRPPLPKPRVNTEGGDGGGGGGPARGAGAPKQRRPSVDPAGTPWRGAGCAALLPLCRRSLHVTRQEAHRPQQGCFLGTAYTYGCLPFPRFVPPPPFPTCPPQTL